jgi:hypothetical protein
MEHEDGKSLSSELGGRFSHAFHAASGTMKSHNSGKFS